MNGRPTAKIAVRASTDGLRYDLASRGIAPKMWFEIDPPAGGAPPPRPAPDFALLALLPHAMREGYNLETDFAVDRLLLEGLDHFQEVWHRWRPDIFRHKIELRCDTEERATVPQLKETAVAAFSGGVDSSFTLLRHSNERQWPGKRKIEAAVMVHGFDMPLDARDGFSNLKSKGAAIAADVGVNFYCVRTNWRDTAPNWQMSFGAGLAAVLHLFSANHRYGMIATEESYENAFTIWGNSFWNDRFFSRRDFHIESDGGAYDRIDRIALLQSRPTVLSNLSVCWAGPRTGENCGVCPKCVLTKLNFTIAGIREPWPFPQPLTPQQVLAMPIKTEWQARFLSIVEARLGDADRELLEAVGERLQRAATEEGFATAAALTPLAKRRPWWAKLARYLIPRSVR